MPLTLKVEFGGKQNNLYGLTVAELEITGKINRQNFGPTWSAVTEAGGIVVSDEVKLYLRAPNEISTLRVLRGEANSRYSKILLHCNISPFMQEFASKFMGIILVIICPASTQKNFSKVLPERSKLPQTKNFFIMAQTPVIKATAFFMQEFATKFIGIVLVTIFPASTQ